MFSTRLSRMYRNKKYSSQCLRHKYRPNGVCINCGKVHKRHRSRWLRQQEIARKVNEGVGNFMDKLKGVTKVFEKGN